MWNETWSRSSNTFVYGWQTTKRRIMNPGQSVKDLIMGTALLEDGTAIYGIWWGGELDMNCGNDATCIYGVPTFRGATTIGRTVLFDDANPRPKLVAHEVHAHVPDVVELGAVSFYATYAGEYFTNRLDGQGHDEAYRNISLEQRGFHIQNSYPNGTLQPVNFWDFLQDGPSSIPRP